MAPIPPLQFVSATVEQSYNAITANRRGEVNWIALAPRKPVTEHTACVPASAELPWSRGARLGGGGRWR